MLMPVIVAHQTDNSAGRNRDCIVNRQQILGFLMVLQSLLLLPNIVA
jgi:hypothetical protein